MMIQYKSDILLFDYYNCYVNNESLAQNDIGFCDHSDSVIVTISFVPS